MSKTPADLIVETPAWLWPMSTPIRCGLSDALLAGFSPEFGRFAIDTTLIIAYGEARDVFEMTSRTVIEPIQNPASARYW